MLGRLVEVMSGQSLGSFLQERVLGPLGMADAGFWVPEAQQGRIAEPFRRDPESGTEVNLLDVRRTAIFESGGGGMVATAMDYARFMQMLAGGGRLDKVRLLGRQTVELMTADHLGSIPSAPDLVPPGHGFGLGFAVRTHAGLAPFPGSVGSFFWGGAAGTTFWVDPVGTADRGADDPGAGAARALPGAVPRPGLCRADRLTWRESLAAPLACGEGQPIPSG